MSVRNRIGVRPSVAVVIGVATTALRPAMLVKAQDGRLRDDTRGRQHRLAYGPDPVFAFRFVGRLEQDLVVCDFEVTMSRLRRPSRERPA